MDTEKTLSVLKLIWVIGLFCTFILMILDFADTEWHKYFDGNSTEDNGALNKFRLTAKIVSILLRGVVTLLPFYAGYRLSLLIN